jgi:hypothetical protein
MVVRVIMVMRVAVMIVVCVIDSAGSHVDFPEAK